MSGLLQKHKNNKNFIYLFILFHTKADLQVLGILYQSNMDSEKNT